MTWGLGCHLPSRTGRKVVQCTGWQCAPTRRLTEGIVQLTSWQQPVPSCPERGPAGSPQHANICEWRGSVPLGWQRGLSLDSTANPSDSDPRESRCNIAPCTDSPWRKVWAGCRREGCWRGKAVLSSSGIGPPEGSNSTDGGTDITLHTFNLISSCISLEGEG